MIKLHDIFSSQTIRKEIPRYCKLSVRKNIHSKFRTPIDTSIHIRSSIPILKDNKTKQSTLHSNFIIRNENVKSVNYYFTSELSK